VQHTSALRASAVYEAMQRALYIPNGRGLYREEASSNSAIAYVWPFSRALLGTLCLAGIRDAPAEYRTAVSDRMAGLARYWARSAYASAVVPPGGDIYYDDNAWIALALILQFRLGLSRSLDQPKQLFSFATAAWDRVASDPYPGGVFWVQQGVGFGQTNHDRGAGLNAGYAAVGLHLHELTGSNAFDGNGDVSASLRHEAVGATNMLNWVTTHLDSSNNGNGPFLNVARRDGSIDTNVWSYNQGVMLGARVLQYRLTRDPAYLHAAEAIARQTLRTFGDFRNHPPSFNAMCFQNMLMLHAASADATLRARMLSAIQDYGEWAWDPATRARDPGTNLFYFDDAGRPALGSQAARLQDQGAMTQLYALLAWDQRDYEKLT
jgi:hypothetical protein